MPTSVIDLAGLGVRAVSIGGVETCIEIPSWKLCFDIGKCPETAPRLGRVLFTHGHADHMGGVVHHLGTREMQKSSPPIYAVPQEYVEGFEMLLAAWRKLNHSDLACEVLPVAPGDRFEVGRNRFARVFRSVHRVPTCGYVLEEERKCLAAEWVGAPGHEIAAARAAGKRVHDVKISQEVVFCGDTTIDVVLREEAVRTAKRLVLELTFLDEDVSREWARKSGHVHLEDVVENAHRFENEAILFTHFSQRYSPRRIRELLDARLPASLRDRVQPLLSDA